MNNEFAENREEGGAVAREKDYEGLSINPGEDRMMFAMNKVIRAGIRALAILMAFVIIWGSQMSYGSFTGILWIPPS